MQNALILTFKKYILLTHNFFQTQCKVIRTIVVPSIFCGTYVIFKFGVIGGMELSCFLKI